MWIMETGVYTTVMVTLKWQNCRQSITSQTKKRPAREQRLGRLQNNTASDSEIPDRDKGLEGKRNKESLQAGCVSRRIHFLLFISFCYYYPYLYLLFLSGDRKESKAAKKEKKARYISERKNKELFLRVWTLYDLIAEFVSFSFFSCSPSLPPLSLSFSPIFLFYYFLFSFIYVTASSFFHSSSSSQCSFV